MSGTIQLTCLQRVADQLKVSLQGEDAPFQGVSSDSRSVQRGNLFIALNGPNFDGSRFLQMAQQRGAAGAIVQQHQPIDFPQIVVEDTLQALGQLAQAWRAQFVLPLLAITGSNGKTTVKEMAASILRQLGPGTVTQGNLNNEIGVPLTLLRITPEDRWAIVEMGASAPGEIARLMVMAQPTAGLVNNAGAAHLGGFGSLQQIVEAKGELYAGLGAESSALINRELPQAEQWREMAEQSPKSPIVEYGCYSGSTADLLQGEMRPELPFSLYAQGEQQQITLPLMGQHNRCNAVAAAALAKQVGATLPQIKQGLEQMKAVPGRLQFKTGLMGSTLIDDTYNASPESIRSAIEVLSRIDGSRLLVLGDMGEMGPEAAQHHHQVGAFAGRAGIDQLFALGEQAKQYVVGFGAGGRHFDALEPLVEAIKQQLSSDQTLLIKGSRFMKMERVVEALLDHTSAVDETVDETVEGEKRP